jgi:hypothetical protein
MGSVAALLRPLVEAVRQHVCAGPVLHVNGGQDRYRIRRRV